ncbi:DNA-processing protein DprA [Microbacterium sp. No. 7]|uniref:DNA-processing protein DprA n=1 Tax=Microbacterium sp. No. 7 TaxID=1714373 RepID=UPI0006CF67C0|nr:DNA-processing protein DprA [Microbacterium sp. No. 7]
MDAIGAVTDERLARVILACTSGPGDTATARLVNTIGAVATIQHLLEPPAGAQYGEDLWRSWVVPRLSVEHAQAAIDASERLGVEIVMPGDAGWPGCMSVLGDEAPFALWVLGDSSRLSQPGVGILGSRAATGYGAHMAGELASDAARDGFVVVSTGAYGVPAAAHRAALLQGGATVAVLPAGMEHLYPAGHNRLFEQIVRAGALVSEVPPDAVATKWRFEQQGRLVAALSEAVVVVEAGARSGSLHHAAQAAEVGRPLGAVPGPVTSAASVGCHRLMRDGAAGTVTSMDDVYLLLRRAGASVSTTITDDAPDRSPARSAPTTQRGHGL